MFPIPLVKSLFYFTKLHESTYLDCLRDFLPFLQPQLHKTFDQAKGSFLHIRIITPLSFLEMSTISEIACLKSNTVYQNLFNSDSDSSSPTRQIKKTTYMFILYIQAEEENYILPYG